MKATVKQEELKGRNRILVIEVSGEKLESAQVERIPVKVDATKDEISDLLEGLANDYEVGEAISENLDRLKENNADLVGLEAESTVDGEEEIEEIINSS